MRYKAYEDMTHEQFFPIVNSRKFAQEKRIPANVFINRSLQCPFLYFSRRDSSGTGIRVRRSLIFFSGLFFKCIGSKVSFFPMITRIRSPSRSGTLPTGFSNIILIDVFDCVNPDGSMHVYWDNCRQFFKGLWTGGAG